MAAQLWELETVLTDAAIVVFEILTGQLFSRSQNRKEQSWSASKAPCRPVDENVPWHH